MSKFELCFVGYMDFKDKEEALEFGCKMEDALGFLTKENLNLYLCQCKEMKD